MPPGLTCAKKFPWQRYVEEVVLLSVLEELTLLACTALSEVLWAFTCLTRASLPVQREYKDLFPLPVAHGVDATRLPSPRLHYREVAMHAEIDIHIAEIDVSIWAVTKKLNPLNLARIYITVHECILLCAGRSIHSCIHHFAAAPTPDQCIL